MAFILGKSLIVTTISGPEVAHPWVRVRFSLVLFCFVDKIKLITYLQKIKHIEWSE
jgi:hypothetical protein